MYLVAMGTLMAGCADVLFAVIVPRASYWAFGFPAAFLAALGADLTFTAGTLFVAKVAHPNEQSVAGALVQAMTQIGLAIGISVSTIVFNGVLKAQSSRLGVSLNAQGDNAPMPAQLKAYKAAMWTGSAFGILGVCVVLEPRTAEPSPRFHRNDFVFYFSAWGWHRRGEAYARWAR